LRYTTEDGNDELLHEFLEKPAHCIYKDTLYPMAWLIAHHEETGTALVNSSLRQGTPLTFDSCPFERWITLSPVDGLPTVLEVLSFYIDLVGPPMPRLPVA
jgi:hypothetical protein